MGKDNNSNSGIGLSGLIFLIFLGLKLAGIGIVANWSWWWIFSPIWIPLIVALTLFVVGVLLDKLKL